MTGSGFELKHQARQVFEHCCESQALNLPDGYFDILYLTADWLAAQVRQKGKTTFGVSGAQGSGKSTFSGLLGNVLSEAFLLPAIVLSMDDFYLTRAERSALANISPMLKTRGVPGTHDLTLALAAKQQFLDGDVMRLPEFSKSEDDRVGFREVKAETIRLLIFEGWCWGAKPISLDVLNAPINELERQDDVTGEWRRYVNEQLLAYQPLFAANYNLFLKVPDFSCVSRWRWQQEQGLVDGPSKMTQVEVERFVMYYERITKQLLHDYTGEADICLALDRDHGVHIEKFPAGSFKVSRKV